MLSTAQTPSSSGSAAKLLPRGVLPNPGASHDSRVPAKPAEKPTTTFQRADEVKKPAPEKTNSEPARPQVVALTPQAPSAAAATSPQTPRTGAVELIDLSGNALPDTLRKLSRRRRLISAVGRLRVVAAWTVVVFGMVFGAAAASILLEDKLHRLAEWAAPPPPVQETVKAPAPQRSTRELSEKLGYTLTDRQREIFQGERRSIRHLLGSSDWNAAMRYLAIDPLEVTNPREFCSFALITQWRTADLYRTEERYPDQGPGSLSKWEARTADGGRFHFVVEQAENDFRVRWDALEQQLRASFPRFCQDMRSRPGVFYAKLKSWSPEQQAQLQVLVEDALPGRKPESCLATVDPASPLGRHLLNVLSPGNSVEAVVSLRWESGKVVLRGIERDLWATL